MNIITALEKNGIIWQFKNVNVLSFEDTHDIHEAFRTLPKLYPNCTIEVLDVMNMSYDEWKLKSVELLQKSSYNRSRRRRSPSEPVWK